MAQSGSVAVVIGASVAGLCAAKVLCPHFDRVLIIERDRLVEGPVERPGVSQARHVHALLARGQAELERLFPGFESRMRESGALEVDFGLQFATLRPGGWIQRYRSGIITLFASRVLFEDTIRRLLAGERNVEWLERYEAIGLVVEGGRVRGLKLRSRDPGASATGAATPLDSLKADLVVDASGRGSKLPAWLREIGLEPPAETEVDSFSGYSSRWFKAPPPSELPSSWWWDGVWADVRMPEFPIAGVLFPVEGGRWIVTMAGVSGNYPPSDEAGFMAALHKLRTPIIAQAVAHAQPISPVYSNRAMANRWRHFERWPAPWGLVALGDAVCAFNPVYGQGMTTATLSALILDQTLKRLTPHDPQFSSEFFSSLARLLRDPWNLATGADFRLEKTVGKRPRTTRLTLPLIDAIFNTTGQDSVVTRRVADVMHMMMPPATLFTPEILWRTAAAVISRRLFPHKAPLKQGALPPGADPLERNRRPPAAPQSAESGRLAAK